MIHTDSVIIGLLAGVLGYIVSHFSYNAGRGQGWRDAQKFYDSLPKELPWRPRSSSR